MSKDIQKDVDAFAKEHPDETYADFFRQREHQKNKSVTDPNVRAMLDRYTDMFWDQDWDTKSDAKVDIKTMTHDEYIRKQKIFKRYLR